MLYIEISCFDELPNDDFLGQIEVEKSGHKIDMVSYHVPQVVLGYFEENLLDEGLVEDRILE